MRKLTTLLIAALIGLSMAGPSFGQSIGATYGGAGGGMPIGTDIEDVLINGGSATSANGANDLLFTGLNFTLRNGANPEVDYAVGLTFGFSNIDVQFRDASDQLRFHFQKTGLLDFVDSAGNTTGSIDTEDGTADLVFKLFNAAGAQTGYLASNGDGTGSTGAQLKLSVGGSDEGLLFDAGSNLFNLTDTVNQNGYFTCVGKVTGPYSAGCIKAYIADEADNIVWSAADGTTKYYASDGVTQAFEIDPDGLLFNVGDGTYFWDASNGDITANELFVDTVTATGAVTGDTVVSNNNTEVGADFSVVGISSLNGDVNAGDTASDSVKLIGIPELPNLASPPYTCDATKLGAEYYDTTSRNGRICQAENGSFRWGSFGTANVEHIFPIVSPSGSGATRFYGGSLDFFSGNSDFSATATFGTASGTYDAHFGIVASANAGGSDTVLHVTGYRVSDDGTHFGDLKAYLLTIPAGTGANTYFETAEKFVGQVSVRHVSGDTIQSNYGYVTYYDLYNTNFTIAGLLFEGVAGANSTVDASLYRHQATGWIYNVGSTPTQPPAIANLSDDHIGAISVFNGKDFRWKSTLSLVALADRTVNGNNGQGFYISVTTAGGGAIESARFAVLLSHHQ